MADIVIYDSLGAPEDVANATGSLHAKIADLAANKIGDSSHVRADNTLMGWMASPIKSIQRSTVNLSGGGTSATATISTVNVAKTMINYLGFSTNAAASDAPSVFYPRISLTNGTTVTVDIAMASKNVTVNFEVIEYY